MAKKMKPELNLLVAMLIFGSIGIFVKNINLPSTAIVLWRTIIGSTFLALVFLLTKQPVSYTHLDVYKRQKEHIPCINTLEL